MKTIKEAKSYLREEMNEGTRCPCCDQFVKLYKRKLNSGMAITLLRVFKLNGYSFLDVKDFLRKNKFRNTHDWTLLKYWGLIEEAEHNKKDTDKKSSGVWRITDKGVSFLLNQITVKSYIRTYNNQCYGLIGDETNIIECLGNKFNYEELMNE